MKNTAHTSPLLLSFAAASSEINPSPVYYASRPHFSPPSEVADLPSNVEPDISN